MTAQRSVLFCFIHRASSARPYQDPDQCVTPPSRPSTLFPGSGLHYSYETCGYVETFGPRRVLEKLTDINGGSPIRLSYPGNDAYRLYRKPDGEVTGSFVEIFTGVQELINTVNKEPVPFQDGVPVKESAKQFVLDEFNVDSSYTGNQHGLVTMQAPPPPPFPSFSAGFCNSCHLDVLRVSVTT